MCFLLQNNKYRYKTIFSIGQAVDILYNDREIARYYSALICIPYCKIGIFGKYHA